MHALETVPAAGTQRQTQPLVPQQLTALHVMLDGMGLEGLRRVDAVVTVQLVATRWQIQ